MLPAATRQSLLGDPVAKKAKKKAAKKARRKSAAKAKKKAWPAAKKKTARAAKPKTIKDRLASAYHTVVDTVKDTDRLRNRLEPPATSETE